MDLTAAPVLVTVAVLAVVAVAAVPWTWDRWSRPFTARLGRSALVLLATTTLLVAGFAFVNQQAGFFPTLHSLVTGNGAAVTVGRDGVLQAVPPRATSPVDLGMAEMRRTPGNGGVLRVQIGGGRTGISRPAAIYLPAAYFDPAQATVRFPVIEVLSGSPGNPAQTLHLLRLADTLDTSIRLHQMSPTVVVVPDTNGSALQDRECVDAAGGVQDDTYLTSDVQAWVAKFFRVLDPGSGWGLLGSSTGGYCAVNLTLRHPDLYAAAASLSGYFHALTDITTGDLFRSSALRNANDPLWRVRHLPLPAVGLWLSAGTGEPKELADLRGFAAALPKGADLTTLVIPEAGHSFSAWRAVLPQALAWTSAQLSPPGALVEGVPGQMLVER